MNDIKRKEHISIWLDDSNDRVLKAFHCPICGKVVFEYYSNIRMIVPGANDLKSPKVVQCHGVILKYVDGYKINIRCKTKFYIS